MEPNYKLFGQCLMGRGVITQEQLDVALHRQQTDMAGRKVGEILVRLGYIRKSHLIECLADQLGIAVVRLSELEIPPHVKALMPWEVAMLYRVVPVEERNGVLVVATADPTNISSMENIGRLLGRPVEPSLAPPEDIREALNKYYGSNEGDTIAVEK